MSASLSSVVAFALISDCCSSGLGCSDGCSSNVLATGEDGRGCIMDEVFVSSNSCFVDNAELCF